MDCVSVCPVSCFYEGQTMLVIGQSDCIDCGICEPECPVEAIVPDSHPRAAMWIELNEKYSESWPNITAYHLAKLIIKFINNLAGTIDGDPIAHGRLKVVLLPDYCVSLAERLIPAADVSNQISTAGYEASGTSNMKFMMNGALTIGTRDGATIEMAEEAGEENFFLFGLTADQVAGSRSWYDPHWHYDNEPETRAALDLIFSDHFSRNEPGIFASLRDSLLTRGDHYMHLADLKSYLEADQRLTALYTDRDAWTRKAILNVAGAGKFSSDHTIAQYATEIWRAKPCPVA
jgi:starch phosphorylase